MRLVCRLFSAVLENARKFGSIELLGVVNLSYFVFLEMMHVLQMFVLFLCFSLCSLQAHTLQGFSLHGQSSFFDHSTAFLFCSILYIFNSTNFPSDLTYLIHHLCSRTPVFSILLTALQFVFSKQNKKLRICNSIMTAVGFEPTPFRTST